PVLIVLFGTELKETQFGQKYTSATTDIWTSPNKKSFISLVVAYIVRTPGSWRLVSLDLECSLFQEAHNGDNIATKLI
ncbi:unnamed protein product, partial [Laminaria digitata]